MNSSEVETKLIETNTQYFVASSWRRLGALGMDTFFITILVMAFISLVYLSKLTDSPTVFGVISSATAILAFVLFAIMIPFAYHLFSYRYWSCTPGKRFANLIVVDAITHKPGLSWKHSSLRTISLVIGMIFPLIPQSVAFFREDRRQLFDLIAGTQVMQPTPRPKPARKRPFLGCCIALLGLLSLLGQIGDLAKRVNSAAVPPGAEN